MQLSDDIFLGSVYGPNPADPNAPSTPQNGIGPVGRFFVMDIVPLTLNATGLGTAQAATGGAFVFTAGTGVTAVLDAQGKTRYTFDVPRAVSVTAAGANTQVPTIFGYDYMGYPMTETAASAPSTSTVTGKKAFKSVWAITFPSTPGSNVSAGTSDKLGIPVAVSDAGYVGDIGWNNTITADAGTMVNADTTSPATALTGDVRGTYTPSSASNGVKRLVIQIALTGAQCGPSPTRAAAFGVAQF